MSIVEDQRVSERFGLRVIRAVAFNDGKKLFI